MSKVQGGLKSRERTKIGVGSWVYRDLAMEVVYEDEVMMVVNKPTKVVVNRARTVKGVTVQEWNEAKTRIDTSGASDPGDEEEIFRRRGGVVHRLDAETSGVLVLAKTPQALAWLMGEFEQREVLKEYVALVHGRFKVKTAQVNLPILRDRFNRGRFRVGVLGKKTETRYEVLSEYGRMMSGGDGFSLLRLRPKTGRTHQLRVVLKHLAHPIVSDRLYLGKSKLKRDLEWCPRLFLHAGKISLRHPVTRERLEFEVPLAVDLRAAMATLERLSEIF